MRAMTMADRTAVVVAVMLLVLGLLYRGAPLLGSSPSVQLDSSPCEIPAECYFSGGAGFPDFSLNRELACVQRLASASASCPAEAAPAAMQFHAFWRGELMALPQLAIKALLVTQAPASRLTLWTTSAAQAASLAAATREWDQRRVTAEVFSLGRMLPLVRADYAALGERLDSINAAAASGPQDVAFSDMVRFVVLHALGGVYIDLDVLLLRDLGRLRPWAPYVYRWSNTNGINTAVLAAEALDPTVKRLLVKAFQPEADALAGGGTPTNGGPAAALHPHRIAEAIMEQRLNFTVFSPYLFDPLWLRADGADNHSVVDLGPGCRSFGDFSSFFQTADLHVRSFPSASSFCWPAFAYHWHNQWTLQPAWGSWAAFLTRTYDALLEG